MSLPPISLDGFDPPFGCGEYSWGTAVLHKGEPWQEHQYHTEVLAWFYHDYMGTHAYVQVWDYGQQSQPDQKWQYLLLRHEPTRIRNDEGAITGSTWAWRIIQLYDSNWAERQWPTFAQVGQDIDAWMHNGGTA